MPFAVCSILIFSFLFFLLLYSKQVAVVSNKFEQGMELFLSWICSIHHVNTARGKQFILMRRVEKKNVDEWKVENKDCSLQRASAATNFPQFCVFSLCKTFEFCSASTCATYFRSLSCWRNLCSLQTPQDMNIAFSSTLNTDIIYKGNHHQPWSEPCLPAPSSWLQGLSLSPNKAGN